MCNRYSVSKRELRLKSRFGEIQIEIEPRYNIAPTQTAPVALVNGDTIILREMRWGFDGLTGQPVTNARSETAHEKRMFRDAWRNGHCIVPCDGFYEWKNTPEGKQPYRFVQRCDLYWLAGLWENDRFAILTAPAQGCVTPMHDRMPVILAPGSVDWWLSTGEARAPQELTQHCAASDLLVCYPVTRAMSNARHVTPDCIDSAILPQRELNF